MPSSDIFLFVQRTWNGELSLSGTQEDTVPLLVFFYSGQYSAQKYLESYPVEPVAKGIIMSNTSFVGLSGPYASDGAFSSMQCILCFEPDGIRNISNELKVDWRYLKLPEIDEIHQLFPYSSDVNPLTDRFVLWLNLDIPICKSTQHVNDIVSVLSSLGVIIDTQWAPLFIDNSIIFIGCSPANTLVGTFFSAVIVSNVASRSKGNEPVLWVPIVVNDCLDLVKAIDLFDWAILEVLRPHPFLSITAHEYLSKRIGGPEFVKKYESVFLADVASSIVVRQKASLVVKEAGDYVNELSFDGVINNIEGDAQASNSAMKVMIDRYKGHKASIENHISELQNTETDIASHLRDIISINLANSNFALQDVIKKLTIVSVVIAVIALLISGASLFVGLLSDEGKTTVLKTFGGLISPVNSVKSHKEAAPAKRTEQPGQPLTTKVE